MTPSSLWSVILVFSFSSLFQSRLCEAQRDVSFQLAHSWAFPEATSSSMILQDTETPRSDLTTASHSRPPLRARTVRAARQTASSLDSSRNLLVPLNFLDELEAQFPVASHSKLAALTDLGEDMVAPNISDRETLLNLARASWDAYHSTPKPDNWYDIHGMNWTSRFGWRPYQDGLRGHLFLSPDKKNGLVVFKGTSLAQLGSTPDPGSSRRDRLNDNLLFSCCCANVPWRVETTHPCDCKVGAGKCCSSCVVDSLRDEETYYKNAELVVHYFQHKYPHTSFWLSGHSLGGSIASLVGIRRRIPTVTFEAPGERLAALRLGLVKSIDDALDLSYITHVYNDVDPLPQGLCTGALSLCAQAGYAIEAKCHTARIIVYEVKKPGWSLALQAHRMGHVLEILENEDLPVPEALPQVDCEDCSAWEFGEFENSQDSWWRRLLGWKSLVGF